MGSSFVDFFLARLAEEEGLAKLLLTQPHISQLMPHKVLQGIAHDRKLVAFYEEARVFYLKNQPASPGEVIGFIMAMRIRAERFDKHPDYQWVWRP